MFYITDRRWMRALSRLRLSSHTLEIERGGHVKPQKNTTRTAHMSKIKLCWWRNDYVMLVHRLRLWSNIKTTLGQRIVFTGMWWCAAIHETLTQCWVTLEQRLWRWPNINPTLCQCLVFAGMCTAIHDSCTG